MTSTGNTASYGKTYITGNGGFLLADISGLNLFISGGIFVDTTGMEGGVF